MNFRNKNSLFTIAVIILAGFLQVSSLHAWKWGNGIIYWDTISYYAYLPAVFIHKDPSLEFIKEDHLKYSNKFWPGVTPEGKFVIKTTYGVSFFYLPFFLAAHLLAGPLGYPADGFSMIYHELLAFSPLLYLLAGLIFLRKILLRYFSDQVSAITLLCVGFGTNLFYYSTITTMSHTYSFALICIFIYTSIQWLEKKDMKTSVAMGLLAGFITLIRPTNILILLFPVLFGIRSIDLNIRLRSFLVKPHLSAVIVIMALFVWLPQFLYWHSQTGNFLFFSYLDDERFFWSDPAIIKGIFGFRKGWLVYTPIMIFAIAGIVISSRQMKEWFLPVAFIIPLAIYVMLSWWTWWYGGGFGMRPIIDYYGLLAIPLAISVQRIRISGRFTRYPMFILLFALMGLGFFHHMQAVHGAIHWDAMTWKTYRHNFGHLRMTPGGEKFLDHPNYERAKKGEER